MKKLFYIFSVIIFFSACNVLDKQPELQVEDAAAITDIVGANAALAGLYNQVQGVYQGRIQRLADVSGTTAQSVGTWDFYREMDTYLTNPDNTEILDIWTFIYRGVNVANNLIASVSNLDAQQSVKDGILGQAYFVRGLMFFDAVRIWGGVPSVAGTLGIPLPKEPSRSAVQYERASLADSYAQVEADLLQALNLLPENNAAGQATKAAANALLSRYCLYVKKYADAERYANAVINNSRFALVTPYSDIFSGRNTTESILELQFNNADQSSLRFWYVPGAIGGRGELAAHTEFYNQMNANSSDVRNKLFAFDNVSKFWYPTKYVKAGNIDNAHLIRLAEVILNRAEARANTNNFAGARADLNIIRGRANSLADNTANSTEQLMLAIERERRFELCYEGHEWFDLVRMGRALAVLGSVPRSNSPGSPARLIDRNRLVFPIPFQEVNANAKMVQNEGYR
ncbi:MAG: RagB/SusD family nutrient uptake outer membrane protein [Cytophagales bacterium]|nr:MAG: RagB/SusD family nutrient uptake outer membrane protein [Cytophagales bacterium]